MKKTLTLNLSFNGETKKVNVAYVSTTATEAKLYAFAQSLAALTQNSLVGVDLTTVKPITGE